jgi:hypothetical protein
MVRGRRQGECTVRRERAGPDPFGVPLERGAAGAGGPRCRYWFAAPEGSGERRCPDCAKTPSTSQLSEERTAQDAGGELVPSEVTRQDGGCPVQRTVEPAARGR